jgi:hypothetical protein
MKLDPSQVRKKIKAGVDEEGKAIWVLDDPLPRGAQFKEHKRAPDPAELAKLEATRRLGGLVPERSAFLDGLARALEAQAEAAKEQEKP